MSAIGACAQAVATHVEALLDVGTPDAFAIVVLIIVELVGGRRLFGLDRTVRSVVIFHELQRR